MMQINIKDKSGNIEGIRLAPFKKTSRKTAPHKHKGYFEIIYLKRGSGQHTIDTHTFAIRPPVIFAIRKDQVHFWDITSPPEGYVLIVKKHFIEQCPDPEIKQLFMRLSALNCLAVPKESGIDVLLDLLIAEEERHTGQNTVFNGLLKALLGKILRSDAAPSKQPNNHSNRAYQQFIDRVTREGELINQVAWYAKQLNTTPQNLNAICKQAVNQSASQVLAGYIVSEAKRQLRYTDRTISEIAFSLHFKDNSHFSRYFKKHTGMTPGQARREV